jgi:phosphate transport system substrate-binding protein
MKLTATKRLVSLTVVVLALVATATAGAKPDKSLGGGSLTGAGSTFVFPLMSQWIAGYQTAAGVTISYGDVGSGAGIAQITARTVDFGASDAPFTPSQQTACNAGPPASTCVQIPWAVSGTSVDYNVPGIPQHIKLTGAVVAQIYLGTITNWNDPAIAKLNPGVTFPNLSITPVYRSDGSGTTYNFTQYLSDVSPTFSAKVGNATAVSFPTGVGGKGSAGVAGVISQTSGAIGYTDVAYAVQSHFQTAEIQNAAGKWLLANNANILAAANTVTKVPAGNAIPIADPPKSAPNAYPICTFTYVMVPTVSPNAPLLRQFIFWALTTGQKYGPPLRYEKIPKVVLVAAEKTLKQVQS